MKKALIIGTDDFIYSVQDFVNPKEMKLIGFGTTVEEEWNVFDENGDIKASIDEMPIMPIDLAAGYDPDVIIAAAQTEEQNDQLKYMLFRISFQKDVIFVRDIMDSFSARGAFLRRTSARISSLGIEGDVAELGCYRGDTAWQLNALFPDRKIFLFDTFIGADPRDIAIEKKMESSSAIPGGPYAFVEPEKMIEKIMERMPQKEVVTIRNGYFPETALDLEDEKFAFVHIDTELYQPTKAGIEFFYPRMSKGGSILLTGYGSANFSGVRDAVRDLEEKYGAFLMVPIGDLAGSVCIVIP